MAKVIPWAAGAFVGAAVVGGAAYLYVPEKKAEQFKMKEKMAVIEERLGRKLSFSKDEFDALFGLL